MQKIKSFDPSSAPNGYVLVGGADEGSKVLLYNESNYNIDIDFLNGNISTLHAWEANYWTLDGDTKQVEWAIDSALNFASPPISKVMGTLYGPHEQVEGTYPVSLIRQTGVGGTVNTAMGSATGVQNDNNLSGTQVGECTFSGSPQSNFFYDNAGNFFLQQYISATLLKLFESVVGATPFVYFQGRAVSIDQNGKLTLGNQSTIVGKASDGTSGNWGGVDSGGNSFLQANPKNNQTVIYDKNGNVALTIDANHCANIAGALQTANGDTSGVMACQEVFSGPVRLVVLTQSGFRQAGGKKMISLKSPFTNFVWIFNGGCGGIEADSGGAAQTVNQVTWGSGGADGTSNAVGFCHTMSAGFVNHAVDAVGAFGSDGAGHTGVTLFIGS